MPRTPAKSSTPSTPQTRNRFQTSANRSTRRSGPPTVGRAVHETTDPQPFAMARSKRFELLCIAVETDQIAHAKTLLEKAVDDSFERFMAQEAATFAHFDMGFHTARAGIANIGIALLNCLAYELKIYKILQTEQESELESSDITELFNTLNPPSHPSLTPEQWLDQIKKLNANSLFEKYKSQFHSMRTEYLQSACETPAEMQGTLAGRGDISSRVTAKIDEFSGKFIADFSWEALTEENITTTLKAYAHFSRQAEEGVYEALSQTLQPLAENLTAQHQTAQRARTTIQSLTAAAGTALPPQVLRLMPAISLDAKQHDEFGNLLHRAVRAGHKRSIKLCLQAGVPLDAVDKDGHTPLDMTDGHGNNILHSLLKETHSAQDDDEDELISDAQAIEKVLHHYYASQAPAAASGTGDTRTTSGRRPAQRKLAFSDGTAPEGSASGVDEEKSTDSPAVTAQDDLHFQVNKDGLTPLDLAARNLYTTWNDHEKTKALIARIVSEMQSVFHYLASKLSKYESGSENYRALKAKQTAIEETIAAMPQEQTAEGVLQKLADLKENTQITRRRSFFSSKTSSKIDRVYKTLNRENRKARIHPETLVFTEASVARYQSEEGLECSWFHQFKSIKQDRDAFRKFRDKAVCDPVKRNQLQTQHGKRQEYPLQFAARLASEKRHATQTLSTWFVRVYATFADAIQHVREQLQKSNTRTDYENLTRKSQALLAQQERCLQEVSVNALAPTTQTQSFWRTIQSPRRHPEDERVEETATAKHLRRSAALLV